MPVARKPGSNKRLLSIVTMMILALPVAFGQSNAAPGGAGPQAANANAKVPVFDVVSVRPSKSTGYASISGMPDGLSIKNFTLWQLVYAAYDILRKDQVSGLPGWAYSSQFDIEAKMDGPAFAVFQKLSQKDQHQQRQLMMQSLLADYFQLKVHYETKVRPIYVLIIAKGGPKLKASSDASGNGMMGNGQIEYRGAPIEFLVRSLSDAAGCAVVDKTGLTGKYDFTLKWAPDEERGAADSGPSLFTALQEQLGLKLESAKGPVKVLVIDHVERPSPN